MQSDAGLENDANATRALKGSALNNSQDTIAARPALESLVSHVTSDPKEVCAADLVREDLSGLILKHYELGRRIGAGGMGQIFEARHVHLGKRFAIKFIASDSQDNDEATGRFLQEIQALGQLQHQNVVTAVDAGSSHGLLYYVTELLDGQDLNHWVQAQGPIPYAAACEIIRQAALGLAYAHQQGFTHRDIKPANIFLEKTGNVTVLDFGLVRTQNDSTDMTCQGQIMGTIDYLAPEQAADARQATQASDLYSLGATCLFLLSGCPPFPDEQYPTILSKLKAHAIDTPPWLEKPTLSVPAGVLRMVGRCLAKQPAQRYPDYTTLCEDLEKFADHGALMQWLEPEQKPAASLQEQPHENDRRSKWQDSLTKTHTFGAAVLIGLVVIACIWNIVRTPSKASSTESLADAAPAQSTVVAMPDDSLRDQTTSSNSNETADNPAASETVSESKDEAADAKLVTDESPKPVQQPARVTLKDQGRSFSAFPARLPAGGDRSKQPRKPFSNAIHESP